jgi:uncharacterized protein YecT (DUF1311 family)
MRNCHCSERFLTSAASVLTGTICIVPLVLGSTVARAQETPIPGASEIVVAQTRETSPTQKDPMSWKDILGKAGPPVSQPTQEPSSRQPSVSAFVLPKLSGRVVDEANLLDQATRAMLTDKLFLLEAKTSDRLVVLTLKSLQGTSIDDFVVELGQYWQIFQSHGSHEVLVLVALNERKVHIQVGYRLQSTLTDAIAKSIIDKTLVPRIGVNDFAGGITSAIDDIIHVLMRSSPESVGQSHGPSFECKSAKNPNEKLICQSTELAELDSNMADLVTTVMDRLNNTDRQDLQKSQRSWLRERLDCGDDFTCTKEAYDERIKHLKSVLAKLSPNPPPSTKTGQLSKGDRLRVANIGPNDVLNMREYPTVNSRIIDGIPPKNEEIIYLGEEQGEWIFVRYGDRAEGWVNRHFVELIVIIPPVPPGRRLQ